jgi:uncharacterized protein
MNRHAWVPTLCRKRHDPPVSAIRDLDGLVGAVLERSTGRASGVHSEHHWQLVGWVGAELARATPDVDSEVVFLFALFHDSMREHDGDDPEHGMRGARLATELYGRHHFASVAQVDLLVYACNEHTAGGLSDDPTIGVCWDADRLNLWRVGTEPDPASLSTSAAREPSRIAASRLLQLESRSWREVAAALGVGRKRDQR